jgi:polar amino acid transport system substrate-binding protein
MRVRPLASLLLAALTGLSAPALWAASCEKLVATGQSEPPYLWPDAKKPSQLVGAAADLADEVGKRLGIKIQVLDSAEALADVQSGRVDLLLDSPLNVELLDSMDFIHPPLLQLPSVVWLRKDSGFSYQGWNDLRGRNGVRLLEVRADEQFESFARANLTLQSVQTPLQAFELLQQGRADYVLVDRHQGAAAVASLGLADAVQLSDVPLFAEKRYLTLSHNSACNDPKLRGQLARTLTEMAESGLAARLIEFNLQRWQAEQAGKASSVQDKAP